jgi:cell division protein FtsW
MVVMERSKEPFGGLLATGLSFSLVIQALVNMAVVVGLGPVTGLPLPFISMGGTALLFTGITVGIILSVSRSTEPEEPKSAKAVEEDIEEEDVELNLKDLESV